MNAPVIEIVEHRLHLIEAILFELLHLAIPEEAVPRIALRLAERAPAFGKEAILACMAGADRRGRRAINRKSSPAAEGPMP